MDILTLTGVPVPDFRDNFGPRLQLIAQSALRIAKATREQVLSTNFEVISAKAEEKFENTHMTNIFEDYEAEGAGARNGEKVLCTTEVGLRCSSGNGDDRRTLVQPEVVLESVVNFLILPPQ
jgi:hypothetical protein